MFKRVHKQKAKTARKQKLEEVDEYLGINDIDSDDSESSSSGSVSEDEGSDSEVHEEFISVMDALATPVFVPELDDEKKSCYICPSVLLKHDKMAQVHLESNTHKRRVQRITSVLTSMDPEDLEILDIHSMVEAIDNEKPDFRVQKAGESDDKSNRAKKRERYATQRKERAAKRKAKRLDKKDASRASQGDGIPTETKTSGSIRDPSLKPKPTKKRRLEPT